MLVRFEAEVVHDGLRKSMVMASAAGLNARVILVQTERDRAAEGIVF